MNLLLLSELLISSADKMATPLNFSIYRYRFVLHLIFGMDLKCRHPSKDFATFFYMYIYYVYCIFRLGILIALARKELQNLHQSDPIYSYSCTCICCSHFISECRSCQKGM